MAAIDITYEDGLRLSELSGQLAGLKYEAANMLAVHALELIGIFVLIGILALLLFAGMCCLVSEPPYQTEFKSEDLAKREKKPFHKYKVIEPAGQTTKKSQHYDNFKHEFVTYDQLVDTPLKVEWKLNALGLLFVFWPWILPFAVVGIMWVSFNAGVDMGIANVQGQIDAILAKYEGML